MTHSRPPREGCGGHVQLTILVLPLRARPIRVDLYPQTVRVGQVERFADRVIRAAGVFAEPSKMRDEASQRRTIGHEDGEVIEAE
jgi:hypothetical protein